MSTRRSAALEVRNSIEAKTDAPDNDVEMRDGSDAEGSEDAEGESDAEQPQGMLGLIQDTATYLCKIEEDGELLAAGFQRVPNKRVLPDYYDIISTPVAFSTIRGKLLRKTYTAFAEFVRDVAQICHNAQVYNRPSAPIFGAAERLRQFFKERLEKLVEKGQITAEEAALPDLGEIPEAEDSPPPESDEEEDEEDEDEEDDESDESDEEEGNGRRRRRFGRSGGGDDRDDDTNKKRGRPPSVFTPLEARIHNILRGLRKPKDDDGALLVVPFERLPDKAAVPDYYHTITNPIALDQIKRKAKRKKYQSVEHAMADVELMFENAKRYNEEGSEVYEAAVELQKVGRELAKQERAKPDDDFRDEDGKLPLAAIEHNGQIWRVGDWVHIRNPNDLAKPIVAQLYRTWQDRAGQKWINACWYYRPEQTVHRYEKHFYEREVVKTGQYRDHHINDVLDHCFVMFVTRFPKGRPRGFPPDKDVYVCESRYNEEKFRFNKIKTWASCVPDEVREKDYEMDLFGMPQRMKKVPSPIKHLLREDAKATDELPKPTWGSSNAPPIVGAVHRRPRENNESPPPEPTPPPSAISQSSHVAQDAHRQPSFPGGARDYSVDRTGRRTTSPFVGSPAAHATMPYNPHAQAQFQSPTPGHVSAAVPPMHATPHTFPQHPQHGTPGQMPVQPVPFPPPQQQRMPHHQTPSAVPPPHMMNPANAGYHQSPATPSSRHHMPPTPVGQQAGPNMYNPPRPSEVYALPDDINGTIPAAVRQNFQTDKQGNLLFFTSPPLDRGHKGMSAETADMGHSIKYLAGREDWLAERQRKRKERDDKANSADSKRAALEKMASKERAAAEMASLAAGAVENWFERFGADTERWREQTGLEGWTSGQKQQQQQHSRSDGAVA